MKVINPPNKSIRNSLNADHAALLSANPKPPHKYNPYPIEIKVDPHIDKNDRVRRIENTINNICFTVLPPIKLEV